MAAPLPSEFAAIVPVNPDNPTCAELRVLMVKLPELLAQWWSSWFTVDGALSAAFTAQICEESCSGSSNSGSTGSPASGCSACSSHFMITGPTFLPIGVTKISPSSCTWTDGSTFLAGSPSAGWTIGGGVGPYTAGPSSCPNTAVFNSGVTVH